MLEVCCDSIVSASAALEGGASRLELVAPGSLGIGGVTPSAGMAARSLAITRNVVCLIRPRGGDFVYSEEEVRVMEADIAALRGLGVAQFAIGALRDDGVDQTVVARLVASGPGATFVFHRAFDVLLALGASPEPVVATLARLGIRRVLTSGGEPEARVEPLARVAEACSTHGLELCVAGKIRCATAPAFAHLTRQFHAASSVLAQDSELRQDHSSALFGPPCSVVSANAVAKLVATISPSRSTGVVES